MIYQLSFSINISPGVFVNAKIRALTKELIIKEQAKLETLMLRPGCEKIFSNFHIERV